MTVEENKALVRRHLIDVYEQGQAELIDDYYTPDGSVAINSVQNWRKSVVNSHKIAPGFKVTILDMVAEGDKVAVYWQIDFTLVSAPTDALARILGKPVTVRHMDILRFAGGKLVAWQQQHGDADMLVKMGAYVVSPVSPA